MTDLRAKFAPDWVSPPGDTIIDIIEDKGWTQQELAERLGYSEKHVSQLVNGKVPLTDDTAVKLANVLGSSAGFWISREAKFREHQARIEEEKKCSEWVDWLSHIPVKELMSNGAIKKTRLDEKNKPSIVKECLRFFGIATPNEWNSHYLGMQVSFRRSRTEQSDIGAISAWLRLGEQEAEKYHSIPKYNRDKFISALQLIRSLTTERAEIFEPQMRKILDDAGVLLVLVPAIPKAHVSGIARWLTPSRPIIQLSLYGKTNDRFWFTFFHEAAHILLHANTAEEKKAVFLDDPLTAKSSDPKEREADAWAGNWLIPDSVSNKLSSLNTKVDVKNFAQQIGVHPGIIVGRLQHDNIIPPSWMNDLKQSFRFID
ncbi:helix-turn-helix domain-containing protein [Kluyvera sichuanensis]|uniref:helix-turn-helix domain-containing protein n=1 Tax=Kluyvera sichuanensis TaxID=2725494 RepID=UPI0034A3B7A8